MTHDDALMKKGLRVRTAVLGREHVRRSFTSGDRYTREIAEVTTKVAWGMVWSRPGLSRKYRSLLNLGALVALGAGEELRVHIRGALRNGLTRREIAEAIIHCAMYAGFPRAAEARRAMVDVFAEIDGKSQGGAARAKAPRRLRR